jgi:hypothetical protein
VVVEVEAVEAVEVECLAIYFQKFPVIQNKN